VARTIDEGFREFHGALLPTHGGSQAAKSYGSAIKTCLEDNFEITRFFRTGSFGNGTSIRDYSDVDYFACIPRENLEQNSFTTLQEVRKALIERFQDVKISIRPPAVKVCFGTDASASIEIVPADFIERDKNGNHIYKIANSDGGWGRSSPDAHNNYVDEVDRKLGGEVKRLVRLLKAWKYYHKVPICSFYLEIYITKYASQKASIVYSKDVKNIFSLLLHNQLAALRDPESIAGPISPCSSEAQRSDALLRLKTALERAQKAQESEAADNIKEAFKYWNLVFAKKFPEYG